MQHAFHLLSSRPRLRALENNSLIAIVQTRCSVSSATQDLYYDSHLFYPGKWHLFGYCLYTHSSQQCPLYPLGSWLLFNFAREGTQGLASENQPYVSHMCIHYCSFLILCLFPSLKILKDLFLFVLWLNHCFYQIISNRSL